MCTPRKNFNCCKNAGMGKKNDSLLCILHLIFIALILKNFFRNFVYTFLQLLYTSYSYFLLFYSKFSFHSWKIIFTIRNSILFALIYPTWESVHFRFHFIWGINLQPTNFTNPSTDSLIRFKILRENERIEKIFHCIQNVLNDLLNRYWFQMFCIYLAIVLLR